MNEERNFPLSMQPEETKKFQFGMVWTVSGQQTIDVPKSLSAKEALEYVKSHWDEIPLPTDSEYITDSDFLDEESEYGFVEDGV